MIVEKPTPGVTVYKKAFQSGNFIEKLEKEIENEWSEVEWIGSSVGPNGAATSYRTSMSASMGYFVPPYQPTELSEIYNKNIKSKIDQLVIDYIMEYSIPSGISEVWHVLKYMKGAEYKAHFDKGPNAPRIFSMVAFLNTPSQGGNLEFPYYDIDIPAEEGTVVFFPSSHPYLHIAHPIEDGIKYSLVTWFRH